MELITGPKPIEQVKLLEPGKKIGKFTSSFNKIKDHHIKIHDGHRHCFQSLRDAGCEIIIAEFINPVNMYGDFLFQPSHSLYEYMPIIEPIIDPYKVLDICKLEGTMDVDYIVYNATDTTAVPSREIKDLVRQRIQENEYVDILGLNPRHTSAFTASLHWLEQRQPSAHVQVRCYKQGAEAFALAHYCRKYQPQVELLIVHPVMYPGTNYAMTSSHPDFEPGEPGAPQSLFDFADRFYSYTKEDFQTNALGVKTELEEYAISLGPKIEGLVHWNVCTLEEFVGKDKILISAWYKGDGVHTYNHRWL
jgi:hypothetical protein